MKSILENFLDTLCKRCGKCCIVLNNEGKWSPCQFLDTESNLCIIYPDRIHIEVAPNHQCVGRIYYPWNIPGCPYNMENKQMHPHYRGSIK